MRQILRLLSIAVVSVLAISSCQEEMVGPHEGPEQSLAGRIASVDAQVASLQATARALSDYSEALGGDFLPALEGADKELAAAATELKELAGSLRDSGDLWAVTCVTAQKHASLSRTLALVPATVEVELIFSPSDALTASYGTLHREHIAKVHESLDGWLGDGILPDVYSQEKLSLMLSLMKDRIIDPEHTFSLQTEALLKDLEAKQAEAPSSDALLGILESIVKNGGGVLDAESTSLLKEHNSSRETSVTEVSAAYKLLAASVAEAVALLAPVQSVVYMSPYEEDMALAEYSLNKYNDRIRSEFDMTFVVRPAALAATLVEDWQTYMSLVSYAPVGSAELSANPPTIKKVAIEGDIMTVTVAPDNIPEGFYTGSVPQRVALQLSNGVRTILSDFVALSPKKMPGFFLDVQDNIPVVKGAQKSIGFNYTASSAVVIDDITVEGNDYVGSCSRITYPDSRTGYVYVNISEGFDVAKQKVTVTLTADGETVTKTLTFSEVGYYNINVPGVLPASGGDITVTPETNIQMGKDVQINVTGGTDWLSKVDGTTFRAIQNTSTQPRTGVVTYEITSGGATFRKTASIVQQGTNSSATCYDMYLGDWTMTASDALAGGVSSDLNVTVVRDFSASDSYLVYGLAPGSGMSHPVRMKYNTVYGYMTLTLPQEGLSESDLGMYPVTLSDGVPVVKTGSETFTFSWNGTNLTANTSGSTSFMYMLKDGSTYTPNLSDRVFYSSASLARAEVEYHENGKRVALQTASAGKTYPLNIIILGDGYQRKDLQKGGKFERSAKSAMSTIFAYEPYRSFQDRFNVWMLPYESADEGTSIENEGVIKDTRYGITCRSNGNTLANAPNGYGNIWGDISAAGFSDNDVYKSMVIVLINTDLASGTCAQIERGTTSSAAVSGDGYKSKSIAMLAANNSFGTNGLIIHEAGGHGFGRLADEYTSNSGNTFTDYDGLATSQSLGFYMNVSPYKDSRCPWYKFASRSEYAAAGEGYYESAYNHQFGIYRPTNSSIMLNNQGKFNAISRYMIYRRIILQSEGSVYTEDQLFDMFLSYDAKNL